MRRRWLALACLITIALLPPALARAQSLPRSVTIATNPPGTVGYTLASGFAKVISETTPIQAVVQPHTGTSSFLPLANSGELDFGTIDMVSVGLAYQGPKLKVGGQNPFPHTPNIRLVMRGSPLMVSLLVRKDSPIKTIHEIKGKRMTGEYPAQLAVWYNMFGHLASAGLTWDDVKVVPVPAVNEGVDALVQGRADVTEHALNAAKVREADAAVGVRHLSIDCSPQGEERVRNAVPGYYTRRIKTGQAAAVVEDTCVIAYDLTFLTHKAAADAVVTAVLKAIWENMDKLTPLHPNFKEWTRERAVDPGATIPYHAAAVQFYKERGLWSDKMDEVQKRLLVLNP